MPARRAILVADDSPEDVFILQRAFLKAGVNSPIMIVKDGQEAVDYLSGEDEFADREKYPFPRLLLLDLKMPRVDGFDVLRWLRNRPELKRLIVTVLSSSDEDCDVNRAYDLGANSYLRKPNSFNDLVAIAKQLDSYWGEINLAPDCVPQTKQLVSLPKVSGAAA